MSIDTKKEESIEKGKLSWRTEWGGDEAELSLSDLFLGYMYFLVAAKWARGSKEQHYTHTCLFEMDHFKIQENQMSRAGVVAQEERKTVILSN